MAYAAVNSLNQTIHRLLNSSHFWIDYSSRQILQSAYEEAASLQEVVQKFDDGRFRSSRRLDAVNGEIRDAAWELEDVLDQCHVPVDLFPSQSLYVNFPQTFSLDLDGDQISSFADKAQKMKEDYVAELDNALLKQEDEDYVSFDFGVNMVGLSNEFASLKKHVLRSTRPRDFVVFSITGRIGSGRTLAAETLFVELRKGKYFECGAWVSVGREYELKDILATILAQIDDDRKFVADDERNTGEYLRRCLSNRRYMIVLDDVWDARLWDLLKSSFPEQSNGSAVLLTTGLKEIAISANSFGIYKMVHSSEEYSWHQLLDWINDKELVMTPEMEEAGRKIANNCGGLAMALTRVGCHLAAAEKTSEYWKKLAADEHNPIFMVADELSEKREINKAQRIWAFKNKYRTDRDYLEYHTLARAIKMQIFPERFVSDMESIAVLGMAGIGKTTLVKKLFGDPSILSHFDHRVWLTLGPKYQSKEILVDILAQIYPLTNRRHLKREPTLSKYLFDSLSCKRCLIVLDDVWTSEPLHYLQKALRNVNGKVLLTTRLAKLRRFGECDIVQQVCLLSKKESWQLFCQKVFFGGSCPPQLEEIGQRISENCEGLPLLILMVADILSKGEKTPEYWNKVAENQSSVFLEACHKLSKVLLPSYQSLPQYLKACFLYMGAFPHKYEISTTKLINHWIVEGLLGVSQNVQEFGARCLLEIADKSLIMILQKGSNLGIKTSTLHYVFWYLSNSEAAKNKFFHAMSKRCESVVDDRKGQRRLCIRNNVLFAIKDVHASLESFSVARSLLCTGPRHPYPVPICFGLRLLRVLSALTIRFYEFPIEVVKLIHLRYLSLICSRNLPSSIYKLQNLQFLIVDRHLRIKSSECPAYMPMEIWDMKELNHLQITGSNLPDPKPDIFLLNLSTLLDVSAHSCTKKVLGGIPFLKRLRVQIELGPEGNGKPFDCLNNLSSLGILKSLNCIVVDPQFGPNAIIPPAPVSMFPSSLKKLTLSGFGYPWEYMSIIGGLKNLELLKLQCYAFRGPVWESKDNEFPKLKYLLIEDADLVCWRKNRGSLNALTRLSIKHCYKLQELPDYFVGELGMIEVVNNNPLTETWAERMKEENPFVTFDVTLQIHSLLDAADEEK